MPANLNRRPVGALGYFGIKNGGQDPQELAGYLQGTFDLTGLYDMQTVVYTQATSALGLGNTVFGAPGSVQSSYYHVLNFGVAVQCGAGANVNWQLGVYRPSQAFFVPCSEVYYGDNTIAGRGWTGASAANIWTGPDEQLCIRVFSVSAAPTLWAWSRSVEYPG